MRIRLRHIFAGLAAVLVLAVGAAAFTLSHTEECSPVSPSPGHEAGFTAVTYRCYGSPDVLELVTLEKPQPADHEILVRVKAAAVNPLDWHYMRGEPYFMRLGSGIGVPENDRMGVDFAGIVEAVGAAVTRFAPGDRVFGGGDGAFAEYLLVSEEQAIAPIPDGVSFEHAAALPVAAVTALQALRDKGIEKQQVE